MNNASEDLCQLNVQVQLEIIKHGQLSVFKTNKKNAQLISDISSLLLYYCILGEEEYSQGDMVGGE